MSGFPNKIVVSLVAVGIVAFADANVKAQRPANGPAANPNPQPQQQVSPELWQLLSDWAQGSASVKKLHGKHERRAYDHTFGVEKVSHGEFWYEAPDKGRIDLKPIKINAQMLADRQKPGAQVERKMGKAFKLTSDDAKRWICDGQKVFDIDDEQKTAQIAHLPPEIRGENIMDSPLPFLFGLPPQKAIERFNMSIVKDYRPKYAVVLLEATPRHRRDAENWKIAKIFLDTNAWLPTAVQLIHPSETKDTRYTFRDLEVNKKGLIPVLEGNPWDPKLSKDYRIHVITPGQDQQMAQPAPGGPVIPDVVGKAHDVATTMLIEAGIPRTNISKQNAGPAPRQNLTYLVQNQSPAGGSPLKPDQKVQLLIFDKPASVSSASKPAGGNGIRRVGNNASARP